MKLKTKTILRFLSLAFLAVASLVSVSGVYALETGIGYGTLTGLGTDDIRVTIMNIIRVLLGFLGVVAIALIVYAGFTWMTAAGNEEKITRAKKILTSAVIGLVIILSAFGIASFIIGQLIGSTGAGGESCNPNQCVSCNARCNADGDGIEYDAAACGGDAYCALPPDTACPRPAGTEPTICKIEEREGFGPGGVPQGAVGQYVTVEGWYFGDYDATVSQVSFDGTAATIVACSDRSTWSVRADGYGLARILIPELADGSYGVTLKNKDNQTSASYQYGIVTAATSKPNLACIEPVSGTNNQTLAKAEGVQFGSDPGTEGGLFFTVTSDGTSQKSAARSSAGTSFASWSDTLISEPVVPALGVSGFTYVADAQSAQSNKIYFTVSCQDGSQCSTGCCAGFSCQPAEACLPGVGQSCDPDPSTPACEPNGVCKPGLLCDGSDCTCRAPGAGANCDSSELPACQPGQCADDRVCNADGVSCTCQDVPLIERISLNDGAIGNLVTINGKYFGTTPGQVFFTSATGAQDVVAKTATEANAACSDGWTDTQIVVEVPAGAVDGPIVVSTTAGSDSSTDARGPRFNNFDVNDTVRPGLCLIFSPYCEGGANAGKSCLFDSQCPGGDCKNPGGPVGDSVVLVGTNFNTQSQVYFGSALADGVPQYQASGSVGILFDALVPAMNPAVVGVRVKDVQSSQFSNALDFTVLSSNPAGVNCSSQQNACSPDSSLCAVGQACNAQCQCETIISCNGAGSGVACSPDSTMCPTGYTCADGQVAGQQACGCYPALSCDSDTSTPTSCEPGNCPTGYACDSNNGCTCQQISSIDLNSTYNWDFQTANAPGSCSTEPGVCSPDSSLCDMNETCDPTTCNCAPIAAPLCVNNDQAVSLTRSIATPQFVNFNESTQTYQAVAGLTNSITVAAWVYPPQAADKAGDLVASTYEWSNGIPYNEGNADSGNSTDGKTHGWSLGDDFDCHQGQIDQGTCSVTEDFYFAIYDSVTNRPHVARVDNFYRDYGNQWVYVVGTFDRASGSIKLYINGNLVAENTTDRYTGPITYPTRQKNLRFGARADVMSQGNWNGLIGDVAIYREALSGAQVRHLSQFRPVSAAPVVHIGFNGEVKDEVSGSVGTVSSNEITFVSGNNSCDIIRCDTDTSTPTCEPGANCPNNMYCDPTSCNCTVGIACDNDTNTPVCDPSNTFCPDSYSCDPGSCTCKPQDTLTTESAYTWFFTTYTFGPTVVELCNRDSSCNPETISSPTPFSLEGTRAGGYRMSGARQDDGAVPVDSIIQGMFSTTMYRPSLTNNILVYPCGSADQPFNAANCSTTSINDNDTANDYVTVDSCNYLDRQNPDADCFTIDPPQLLQANQWYQVVLRANNMRGSNGIKLNGNDPSSPDYRWVFKTRNSNELGEVECLYVNPAARTSYYYNQLSGWTGNGSPAGFVCAVSDPGSCNAWGWRTNEATDGYNPERAVIASFIQNIGASLSKADTVPNPPVDIVAQCTAASGATVSGEAKLTIDFTTPIVIDQFPDCGTACLNAKIGARFSLPMDAASVRSAMKLYVCYGDATCAIADKNPVVDFSSSVNLDPAEEANTFTGQVGCYDYNGDNRDDYCLLPNSYYRVVIGSTAHADRGGKGLGNLNYDADGVDGVKDSYSWVFKTQEDYGLCTPQRVNVNPASQSAPVNVTLPYAAQPLTAPDSCEPDQGQRLNPYGWDWNWSSNNDTVATLVKPLRDACGNGVLEWGESCDDGNTASNDGCSNVCLNEGSNASWGSSCGDGVIGAGEECDTPNSNFCSANCLWTGNTNYNTGGVCGNGVIERNESCERPGSRGCGASCTLTGSAAGAQCGNGRIETGEECDDGELASGPVRGGDGCSVQCLVENRNQAFCRNEKTNVFDFSAGSCTGGGSCAQGYTCVSLNTITGNTTKAMCGNGVIETGEQCDIGGICSDNGAYCTTGDLSNCANPATANCRVLDSNDVGFCSITHNTCTNIGQSCVSITGTCSQTQTGICEQTEGGVTTSFAAPFCDNPAHRGALCAAAGECQPRVLTCTAQCLNPGSVYETIDPPTVGAYQSVQTQNDGETYIVASVAPSGPEGSGYLLVGNGPNDGKFRLVETWPGCNFACRNADLGGRFNKSLNLNTIVSALVNPETVSLYECGLDGGCANKSLVGGTNISVYDLETSRDAFRIDLPPYYNPVDNDQNPLTPAVPTLLPNTYYRVIVDARVKSSGDETMANLNFDQNGDGTLDAYSWIFQTSPENDLCGLDYVKVIPGTNVLPDGGVRDSYFAQPWSEINSCNGRDQRLNPYFFDWRWSADPTTGADFVRLNGQLMDGCGNGIIERGEACDPGLASVPGCNPVTCQLTSVPAGTNPGVPVTGLRAQYHFENSIFDSSASNVNGTSAAITFGPGVAGQAAIFNGASAAITLPTTTLSPSEGTIMAWVKVKGYPQPFNDPQFGIIYPAGHIVYAGVNGNDGFGGEPELNLSVTGDRKIAFYYGGNTIAPGVYRLDSSVVELNKWYLVVVTYKNNDFVRMYVDGTQVAQDETDRSLSVSAFTHTYIGRSKTASHRFFEGELDELALYSRALSTEEIRSVGGAIGGICGNSVIDSGEQCDDGNVTDGYCSTNGQPCNGVGSACGAGGQCISDGCGVRCTFNGSVARDNRIDPYQIIQTVQSLVDAGLTQVKEIIRAWSAAQPGRPGEAELTVVADSSVPFAVIGHQPPKDATNQCLNVAAWAVFSRDVNLDSVGGSLKLCEGNCTTNPNLVAGYSYRPIQGACVNNQCDYGSAVDGANQYFGSCDVDADCRGGKLTITKLNTADGFLKPNTNYQISANGITSTAVDGQGNALTLQNCNAANTSCAWTFRTGADFCQCESVGVGILPTEGGNESAFDSFICAGDSCGQSTLNPFDDDVAPGVAGNQHRYDAQCYDTTNVQGTRMPLAPASIAFTWAATSTPPGLQLVTLSDALPNDGIYNSAYFVTPFDKNGQSIVTAAAQQYYCGTTNRLCDPSLSNSCGAGVTCAPRAAASQDVRVINFMCENPWPAIQRFPYRDNESNLVNPDTNFELFYCRDFGATGFADDLPALSEGGPVIDPVGATILKDFIFPVGAGAGQELLSQNGNAFTSGSVCYHGSATPSAPRTNGNAAYCFGFNNSASSAWQYSVTIPSDKAGSYSLNIQSFNVDDNLAAVGYCDDNNDGMLKSFETTACNPGDANVCGGTGTCRVGITHVMQVLVDNTSKGTIAPLATPQSVMQNSTITLGNLSAGTHTIEIRWLNDWNDYSVGGANDSNLAINRIGLTQGTFSADALGVRVLQNPLHLSPQTWYQSGVCQASPVEMANICFADSDCNDGNNATPDVCTFNVPTRGQIETMTVDGYQAIRDGRTVYVGATNLSTGLFSNIYLISYNQDAAASTVEIFNRILDQTGIGGQWLFNSNVIYSDKEKIKRDADRFGDLRDIQLSLDNFRSRTGAFPSLLSGSYIASTTFSVWPSWQQTFGAALGQQLPTDPENVFYGCPASYCDANGNSNRDQGEVLCGVGVSCATCRDVSNDQKQTCWDQLTLQFSCPADMYAYAYRSPDNGASYNLYSNFEYEGLGTWRTVSSPLYQLPTTNGPQCRLLDFEISAATVGGGTGSVTCPVGQSDTDKDGVCTPQDNCPTVYNPDQRNTDGIGGGNACDSVCSGDADNDGVCDNTDICRTVYNPRTASCDGHNIRTNGQCDFDQNGIGDACDPCTDRDGDRYADLNTGANDFRLCPLDNAVAGAACTPTSDRRSYCTSAAGVPRAKTCTNVNECNAGETCAQPNGAYASYNPFQEDYDDDGVGYICDRCIDFDNDGFGDYSFFTRTVGNITLSPAQAQHFEGCSGTHPIYTATVQTGTTKLDNCPAGPFSAVCKDQFGITVSCANPDQADTNKNNVGNICDTFGNGVVDSGEICDCGETLPYSVPTANPFVCTSPNNTACVPGSGGFCRWCENGRVRVEGVGCGDGSTQSPEACDAGINNGVNCAPGTGYGQSCNWCTLDCQQRTTFSVGGGCGDGLVQRPQEQCDLAGRNGNGTSGCSAACQPEPGFTCDANVNVCSSCASLCTTTSYSVACGQTKPQGQVIWQCAPSSGSYFPECKDPGAPNQYCGDGVLNGSETYTIGSGVFCSDGLTWIDPEFTQAWQVHLIKWENSATNVCTDAVATSAYDDTQVGCGAFCSRDRIKRNSSSIDVNSQFGIEIHGDNPIEICLSFIRDGNKQYISEDTGGDEELAWITDNDCSDADTDQRFTIFHPDGRPMIRSEIKYHVPFKMCNKRTGKCVIENDATNKELKASADINGAGLFEFRNNVGNIQ